MLRIMITYVEPNHLPTSETKDLKTRDVQFSETVGLNVSQFGHIDLSHANQLNMIKITLQ